MSASRPSTWPSTSRATRCASVPSVTLSINPAGKPDQRRVVVDRVVEAASGAQKPAGKDQVADTAIVEVEVVVRQRIGKCRQARGQGRTFRCRHHRDIRIVRRRGGQIRDQRAERGAGPVNRQATIQHANHAGGGRAERPGQARGVLAKVRRAERVAQETPHLAGGRAVVIPVDRDGERDAWRLDQRRGEGTRAAAAGKQHDSQGRDVGGCVGHAQLCAAHRQN